MITFAIILKFKVENQGYIVNKEVCMYMYAFVLCFYVCPTPEGDELKVLSTSVSV